MIGKKGLVPPSLLLLSSNLVSSQDVIYSQKPELEWDSTNISTLSVYAGMAQTLTEAYFRDYESRLIDAYSTKMEHMDVPEYCSEQAIGSLFTTHLCIGEQTISSYSVDESISRLRINPAEKALNLHLSEINLEFAFDFKVWSEPEWIKDSGSGTISVTGSNINLDLVPQKNEIGALTVAHENAKINTRDYEIKLEGTSDISRAVESMLANFKVFFEQELISMLGSRLAQATEELLTERLSLNSDESTLLGDPIVENNLVAFILDGSLESCGTQVDDYPRIPVHIGDPKARVHFEQFVSEMTLESALQSLVDDNMGGLTYSVSSDFMNKVVPNFKDVFGKHDDIEVKFDLGSVPDLTVRTEGSSLSTDLVITVINPYNAEYEALIIYASATAQVEFKMIVDEEQYRLIGVLQDGQLTVSDHKMLFYSETTVEDLQEKASVLEDFLLGKLNGVEESGKGGLVIGRPIDEDKSEARLFVYDGFITIEAVALLDFN